MERRGRTPHLFANGCLAEQMDRQMNQWHLAEGWGLYLGGPLTVAHPLLSLPNPSYIKTGWRPVEHCAGIKALVCPLMCLKKLNLYSKFKGRVQAASAHGRSPRVESRYLEYLFDGKSQC